jgi:hypothetical protein
MSDTKHDAAVDAFMKRIEESVQRARGTRYKLNCSITGLLQSRLTCWKALQVIKPYWGQGHASLKALTESI